MRNNTTDHWRRWASGNWHLLAPDGGPWCRVPPNGPEQNWYAVDIDPPEHLKCPRCLRARDEN